MRKVDVKESKIVFDDFYKMEEATFSYELPDGKMTEPVTRLCFHRGDGVAAAVYNTDTKKAFFVKQFRYPCYTNGEGWILEVVAGMLGKEEDATEAMKREIEEEIGYKVSSIESICHFYVSPGGTSERIFLFYAEVNEAGKVSAGGGLEHEAENIEVMQMTLDELKDALASNGIPDGKSIMACNYMLQKHNK